MALERIRNDSSIDGHLEKIERMGRVVSPENLEAFEKTLHSYITSTTVNISKWTFHAIKSLLLVSKERNIRIRMIYDGTHIAPIALPKGPMLDMFVQSILDGSL